MSTCSQKVRLILAEKGLAYEAVNVDLGAFEHVGPAYLAINPNGVVPALEHDGAAIVESTVIGEYLDEVFPDPPLSPPDPLGRARMRVWLRYLDEVPSMAIRVPTFQHRILPAYQRMTPEAFVALADRMPLRKGFILRMGQTGFTELEQSLALEQLAQAMDRMEAALASGDWLLGDAPSLADFCAFPVLHRMTEIDLGHLWSARPAVAAWYARLVARPSHDATYYPAARIMPAPD
jgi:glutathione S-transferase